LNATVDLYLIPPKYKTPLRYFLAVVCGYCIDLAIYVGLIQFGVSVYFANAVGFCVGVVVNVLLIRKFVFLDSRFKLRTDLPLSFASYALIFILGMGILWVLVEMVKLNPYAAKLLANGITFTVNFTIRAGFFRKRNVF